MLGPEKLKAGIEGQERVEKMKNEIGIKKKEESPVKKEAYDIVLEYLFSEGHVESISEAHYVMMQMDAKYIQSIVEKTNPDLEDPSYTRAREIMNKSKPQPPKLPKPGHDPITGLPPAWYTSQTGTLEGFTTLFFIF